MTDIAGVDPTVPPSGTGCVECNEANGWWFHLRRCAQCGHIGCCDTSPSQHASAHAAATGHPMIRSFEPGESWFWSFPTEELYDGGPGASRLAAAPALAVALPGLEQRAQLRQAADDRVGDGLGIRRHVAVGHK